MAYQEWVERVKESKAPNWFKAKLLEALVRKPTSSSEGTIYTDYSDVGYHLGIFFEEFLEDEVLTELESELYEILVSPDENKPIHVAEWLEKYFGEFYGLVPHKRRPKFVEGFISCVEERGCSSFPPLSRAC